MDSLTQIALGAAVGEAVAGKHAGWRGAAWGAGLGTLPDLDILAYPFLDSVGELAFHRGVTHSLFFAVLMTPLIGAALARLHRRQEVPPRRWMWLVFLVIGTHILLDCFTVYGTQVFQPFSDFPLSWNSLFILDPLYTVPLTLGVLTALCLRRESPGRQRANRIGLALSTLYVLWAVGAKMMATTAIERGFEQAGIDAERVMTNPMPLNTVLWMGIAEAKDTLHVGLYSLLDEGPPREFLRIPKRTELIEPFSTERATARLLRFSKGWFSVSKDGERLLIDDLRFGRSDAWLGTSGQPIFRFELLPGDCPDTYCGFRQIPPTLGDLSPLWTRIKGRN